MAPAKIPWYSKSPSLATEEHDAVDLGQAIRIADGFFARAGEKFEDGEEALAATMFGFGSDRDYVEFCVHGADHISCDFRARDDSVHWLLKPFLGNFQHQDQLRSRDELIERIREFFSSPPAEMVARIKGNRG